MPDSHLYWKGSFPMSKPKCRNCGAETNLHQHRFDKKYDCGACLQELQDMTEFDTQNTF